jgi:hypothetical protein
MTYFGELERVEKQLSAIKAMPTMRQVRLWAGLGAYIKDSEKIAQEAAIADQLGFNGISLFSLGHIQRKKGGCRSYIQAVNNGDFDISKLQNESRKKWPAVRELKLLNLLAKPYPDQADPALIRLTEFITACKTIIPQALNSLEKSQQIIPAWLEIRGIFRFVHPLDSLQRQEEQRQLCAEARRLLKKGKDFKTISRSYSQAGTRQMGGDLPRCYFGADKTLDELFKLQPGEISPIIRRPNGYWCYQLKQKSPPKTEQRENIPWPARRVLFKKFLSDSLQDGNSAL